MFLKDILEYIFIKFYIDINFVVVEGILKS